MLKINLLNKTLNRMDSTLLKSESLLERQDLQQFIVNSWEEFKNEIGLPTAILIGQEIKPHESVQDSIDILAFNQDDSSIIVIELKREKNKYQLLQALSYAAMVATWDSEKLLAESSKGKTKVDQEALDVIGSAEPSDEVQVILIAEKFDPEVIITSDWLVKQYGLSITAFSVGLHKIDNQLVLDLDQKYPLPELSEAYVARRRSRSSTDTSSSMTWEQVIPKLKYPFAERAIAICKRIRGEGDPARRRFGDILRNIDGFNWISLNFREKYLNVYTGTDDKQAATQRIKSIFGSHMEVNEWRDGVSFLISKNEEFEKLVTWMKLEQ